MTGHDICQPASQPASPRYLGESSKPVNQSTGLSLVSRDVGPALEAITGVLVKINVLQQQQLFLPQLPVLVVVEAKVKIRFDLANNPFILEKTRPNKTACQIASVSERLSQAGARIHSRGLSTVVVPERKRGCAWMCVDVYECRCDYGKLEDRSARLQRTGGGGGGIQNKQ
ncbi:hypothetical protein EJ05DRAFT_535290 [Pseudovirgaria hyperparasitica]|uniref:Uncharacterized protein n=1 Tax=Pseudovirgaria hyperparasitica TaxID=470096 RepID=A0A6A6WIP5_9PEZI|nr:uncharacterized protein EJ05DRAFT_535290 [Pseudovirgaria hyperparasitica]KAF2761994.1 hypothetical protein EJ05DRAFT_535290 [Pseudovirgaria hyperparasitica]